MAKTRKEKEEIVAEIAKDFKAMTSAAFSSISGFTMTQADELREKADESGAKVFVAKKTLLDLASKEAGLEELDPLTFTGSILTTISFDDAVTAAKLQKELTDVNEDVEIISGVLEGNVLDAGAVIKLAELPTREELLSKMVGSINAPISGFVGVLSGNLRGLVSVLGAIKDQKA